MPQHSLSYLQMLINELSTQEIVFLSDTEVNNREVQMGLETALGIFLTVILGAFLQWGMQSVRNFIWKVFKLLMGRSEKSGQTQSPIPASNAEIKKKSTSNSGTLKGQYFIQLILNQLIASFFFCISAVAAILILLITESPRISWISFLSMIIAFSFIYPRIIKNRKQKRISHNF